jgi:hypothetical protein
MPIPTPHTPSTLPKPARPPAWIAKAAREIAHLPDVRPSAVARVDRAAAAIIEFYWRHA